MKAWMLCLGIQLACVAVHGDQPATAAVPETRDVTTGDGHVHRGVTKMEIDGTGQIVTLISGSGRERVTIDSLSKDWQIKLQPAIEEAKKDGADNLWKKRIKAAEKILSITPLKKVTASLQGPHHDGIRAYLTSESQGRKTVQVTTEIIIAGLPAAKKFGNWSGTLKPKTVYADRKTDQVLQVWSVLK